MSNHNDLLVAIRQITRAIDLNSRRLLKSTGLTAPQLIVLQTLEETGRAKPSDIAKAVHLSQATVTSIVDRLVRADLVTREKSDIDRRVVDVVITDAGRARIQQTPTLLQDGFLLRFERLQSWEQTQLVSSLQRLATLMNAEDIDAAPILQVGDITNSGMDQ